MILFKFNNLVNSVLMDMTKEHVEVILSLLPDVEKIYEYMRSQSIKEEIIQQVICCNYRQHPCWRCHESDLYKNNLCYDCFLESQSAASSG